MNLFKFSKVFHKAPSQILSSLLFVWWALSLMQLGVMLIFTLMILFCIVLLTLCYLQQKLPYPAIQSENRDAYSVISLIYDLFLSFFFSILIYFCPIFKHRQDCFQLRLYQSPKGHPFQRATTRLVTCAGHMHSCSWKKTNLRLSVFWGCQMRACWVSPVTQKFMCTDKTRLQCPSSTFSLCELVPGHVKITLEWRAAEGGGTSGFRR